MTLRNVITDMDMDVEMEKRTQIKKGEIHGAWIRDWSLTTVEGRSHSFDNKWNKLALLWGDVKLSCVCLNIALKKGNL